MPTLRSTLSQLAADFAADVLRAIRGASFEEILQESGNRAAAAPKALPAAAPEKTKKAAAGTTKARRTASGRLGRRSADDIEGLIGQIADLLAQSAEGLRAEQIREALGIEAKELPRPLADALASGRISKKGQKRATTYFVGGGGGGEGRKSKGKRTAKKGRKGKRRSKKSASE